MLTNELNPILLSKINEFVVVSQVLVLSLNLYCVSVFTDEELEELLDRSCDVETEKAHFKVLKVDKNV